MVQRFAAATCSLDENTHLLLDARLPDVIHKLFGSNRAIEDLVVRTGLGCRQPIVLHIRH